MRELHIRDIVVAALVIGLGISPVQAATVYADNIDVLRRLDGAGLRAIGYVTADQGSHVFMTMGDDTSPTPDLRIRDGLLDL